QQRAGRAALAPLVRLARPALLRGPGGPDGAPPVTAVPVDAPEEEAGRCPAPQARKRPGLVALLYAYRALAGLLVALPAAITLGAPTASWPRRQAEIFDPGSTMLLESLRLS